MKKLLSKIWKAVSALWQKADDLVTKITPVAINIVEGVKTINSNTTGDIIELVISKAIPGTADDKIIDAIREKLKTVLPKVLVALNISNSIAKLKDSNAQLKAILVAINMSSDEAKNAYYHSLSCMILQSLSDGKLTWSESVQIAEYYYSNIYKNDNEQGGDTAK